MALQGTGSFTPKQLKILNAKELQELQSDVSEQIIRTQIKLLPAIPPNAVIHDNGCGAGAVTSEILKQSPDTTGLQIMATDINEHFVHGVQELVQSNGWPVTASVQDSRSLSFPDEFFDYTFISIVMHCVADPPKVAAEMYRTLKKGGHVSATVWVDMPHGAAVQEAHWATRGRDGPMPMLVPLEEYDEKNLVADLVAGGFEEEKITLSLEKAYTSVKDVERWVGLAWSFLGYTENGWQPSDEENWDQAVRVLAEKVTSGRNTTRGPNGELVIAMTAAIATATK